MKTAAFSLLLALVAASPDVRFEADGVRVGSELVSAKALSLKGAGALPILASGAAVENLSAKGEVLNVGLSADRSVSLATGLRLERSAGGFKLSSHGPAFVVQAAGKCLSADSPVEFKLTEKGFDFGALGALEAAGFAAALAKPAAQGAPQRPQAPSAIRPRNAQSLSVLWDFDPFAQGEAASSNATRQQLSVTPTGAP